MDTKDRSAWKRDLLPVLPSSLALALGELPEGYSDRLEEIRIRALRPLLVMVPEGKYLSPRGEFTESAERALCAGIADCVYILERISQHSIYAIEQEMRCGYISLQGGYRVGFCGKPVTEEGKVRHFANLTSFCIRIAREHKGCADKVMPYLFRNGELLSTLVLSPPRCGKTTIIRDIARQLSWGGRQVVIVDERSEIAGSFRGVPQNDVGPMTDVLDACPKAEGMRIALRAMSPDVLVTDEIGSREDRRCIVDAAGAGVAAIASAHAASIEDAMKRPVLSELLSEGLFGRVVTLSRTAGAGTLNGVYDGETLRPLIAQGRAS